MLFKFNYKGKDLEISQRLKIELDILINSCVKDDDDCLIVFDGLEGAGKTTLKTLVGAYISWRLKEAYNVESDYTVDNIMFDGDSYINYSLKPKCEHQINDLDEATDLLNRKSNKTQKAIQFTNYLRRCRFMNQFHLITSPAFHDLNSYIIKWRMKLLIHVDKFMKKDESSLSGYSTERGYFKVFYRNNELLKHYNLFYYNYLYPTNTEDFFKGTFKTNKNDILDWNEYNKKKDLHNRREYLGEQDGIEEMNRLIEIKGKKFDLHFLKWLHTCGKYKINDVADILNIDRITWYNIRRNNNIGNDEPE